MRYNNFCLTKDTLIAVKLFLVTPQKSDKTTNWKRKTEKKMKIWNNGMLFTLN